MPRPRGNASDDECSRRWIVELPPSYWSTVQVALQCYWEDEEDTESKARAEEIMRAIEARRPLEDADA